MNLLNSRVSQDQSQSVVTIPQSNISSSPISNSSASNSVISSSDNNSISKDSYSSSSLAPSSVRSISDSSLTPETDIEIDIISTASEYLEKSHNQKSSVGAFVGQFMDIKTIRHQSLHPVVKSFLVGSISGTCSTVLFQPLDLLKTRLQAPTSAVGPTPGIFNIAGNIVRHETIFGLWKGMVPSLTRCVPGVGIYFASIHGLRLTFDINETPTAMESILLGATGRSFTSIVMIPFTVIKTRFESRVYHYGSISEALRLIYRTEGVHGLTCGLLPTILRDAPFSGLYLMMYNSTKTMIPGEWIDSNTFGPSVRFSCGIVAGFGASIITQPADVIKTKMQLFPDKFHTIPPVIKYVYEKYGIQGYFKGLMPRMVRRTLVAAMSWTVYEQVMKNIGLK